MKKTMTTLAALACMLLPAATEAATFFPKENVTAIDAQLVPGTAMYAISFRLGGVSDSMTLPIMGVRDQAHKSGTGTFGFAVEAKTDEGFMATDDGRVTSLLISDADVVDNQYHLPAGEYRDFTFLIFLDEVAATDTRLRYRVVDLPFMFAGDAAQQHFSTGELKYLVSGYEVFNRKSE